MSHQSTTSHSLTSAAESSPPEVNRLTQQRLRLRIPKDYQQEPILSTLIAQYGLTVNISAAILGADGSSDGWFDLQLSGREQTIVAALAHLEDLNVEFWTGADISGW